MKIKQSSFYFKVYFYPPELPSSSLYLIGLIHRIPALEKRLKDLLLKIKPQFVTLEISLYSLSVRKRMEKVWLDQWEKITKKLSPSERSHPEVALYKEALRIPYEVRTLEKLKIPFLPIDSSFLSKPILEKLIYNLTFKNIKSLSLLPLSKDPLKQELALALFCLRKGFIIPRSKISQKREVRMIKIISLLQKKYKPLVHIGGWRHLPHLLKKFPKAKGIFLVPTYKAQGRGIKNFS